MEKRKDFGAGADEFFDSLDGTVAALARSLRSIIRQAIPGVSETIKWGIPVYETDKLICAVRPSQDYIALQFYASGTSLPDPDGLLEGTGKKMRHVKIRTRSDIKKVLFTSWIAQAAEFNSR
ncbi:MAG: DUF1801 domain-containing protein [Planctomycetales bacterium]|nr:DUF1801 domain-containing protein [Planctomycetales bacterium]